MQATVHDYDPERSSGTLVTDQGILLPFDAAAFATARLRLLRPGQRLTVEVEGSPDAIRADAIRVVSMRLESVGMVPVPDGPQAGSSRS